EDLQCLTAEIFKKIDNKPLHEVCQELASARLKAARRNAGSLAERWTVLLGDVTPPKQVDAAVMHQPLMFNGVIGERYVLHIPSEAGDAKIPVPVLLLMPAPKQNAKLPVVVAFAQEGKQALLKHRAETIATLLKQGVAVCLLDLRGTGETKQAGDSRGRGGLSTSLSASELMLGQTMLGQRLRDLRSVLALLRQSAIIDSSRMALWGDSFAAVNPAGMNFAVPWDAEKLPAQSEPGAGLLALLGALLEPQVKTVYVRGGLASYQTILESPFLYVPHDAILPGALTAGDMEDMVAALAPRAIKLESLVD